METDSVLVTFWGTRGSISTPGSQTEKYGGNTPCIGVQSGSTTVIFDAGTGIRNLGLQLAARPKEEGPVDAHIFLTHTHWDHIQGLPFFTPAYIAGNSLSVYGSPRKEMFLEQILQGQMNEDYFPVKMSAFNATMKIQEIASHDSVNIGKVRIEWMDQPAHPGGSVHYKVCVGDKKVVYATDVELDIPLGPDPEHPASPEALEQYRAFVRGVDLLIADGQYTETEYVSKKGWGHTSLPSLLHVLKGQGVKQLAVFHHDPQHSDTMLDGLWSNYGARYMEENPDSNIFWAREGMTVRI